MGATDQMLASYMAEIEERQAFADGIIKAADGKDLSKEQMDLLDDVGKRIAEVDAKVKPLLEMRRISGDSAQRVAEIAKYMTQKPPAPENVEYRSAGAYALDYWAASMGVEEAQQRFGSYNRAAAHQTTTDNPGLLPTPIVEPIINFIDQARPLISLFGAKQLPAATWSRPRVTQHTQVAAQSAEKAELVSRKMLISKLAVTPVTLGGYVNVSRQDIDWSQPQVMDLVIQDLAGQYALVSEDTFADALMAAATAETALPTGTATAAQVTGALWTAVGNIYAATKGIGRLFQAVSPDMLGTIFGPMYAPINPQNAQSPGYTAADYGQGSVGVISGIPMIVSAGLNAGSWLVGSTAAAEVYEDRLGSLQVVEPSVLGVQVAYAGYFASIVIEPTALRKIAKTP